MWFDFIEWVKRWPLKHQLLDPEDVALLFPVKDIYEAFKIIMEAYRNYKIQCGSFASK